MSGDDFDELVRKSEGELTSRRAAELDQALSTSPELQQEQARLDQLITALGQPSPGLDEVDLREGLWERGAPVRPARRWWWGAGAAMAAAAAMVLWFSVPGEFTSKGGGGSPAGFEGFVLRGDQAAPLGQSIHSGDALGFAYRNLPGSPYRALMIYAVDSSGQTFWYYPAWLEGQPPPSSLLIGTSPVPVELREAVRHQFAPGRLEVHALFSKSPHTVLDVEAHRAPAGDYLHFTLQVQVVP